MGCFLWQKFIPVEKLLIDVQPPGLPGWDSVKEALFLKILEHRVYLSSFPITNLNGALRRQEDGGEV